MSSLAILSRYKFASSAEEKVIRVFQAPENFRSNFLRICNILKETGFCKLNIKLYLTSISKCVDFILVADVQTCAKGAAVPSLGLSNKAVYEDNNDEEVKLKNPNDMYPEESHFTAIELSGICFIIVFFIIFFDCIFQKSLQQKKL